MKKISKDYIIRLYLYLISNDLYTADYNENMRTYTNIVIESLSLMIYNFL